MIPRTVTAAELTDLGTVHMPTTADKPVLMRGTWLDDGKVLVRTSFAHPVKLPPAARVNILVPAEVATW